MEHDNPFETFKNLSEKLFEITHMKPYHFIIKEDDRKMLRVFVSASPSIHFQYINKRDFKIKNLTFVNIYNSKPSSTHSFVRLRDNNQKRVINYLEQIIIETL